eukprot:6197009-Pleurochrysis_carterae.AAC.1
MNDLGNVTTLIDNLVLRERPATRRTQKCSAVRTGGVSACVVSRCVCPGLPVRHRNFCAACRICAAPSSSEPVCAAAMRRTCSIASNENAYSSALHSSVRGLAVFLRTYYLCNIPSA